jgi:hypothetical protein
VTRRKLVCPNGHRFPEPRILYGYPTPEAVREAEEGKLVLGGCDPTFPVEIACPECGEPVGSGVGSGEPRRPVEEGSKPLI